MPLLQGTELYSTSITPNNPNLQFDAQVAGSLQQKYDAGYDRASVLYGSIMNPDLSRTDTQKAKEEYLRMVDQDLKAVGKMDWSISENITSAENLFRGMWSNKLLLKDASWTKKYKEELSRADGFKNCLDASKCGGQYWDEGVKYMEYKRQEFANADANSALGFDNVSYVPYNSVMDDAIKEMKAADLSMKTDDKNGGYIITTKNGEQLRSPLSLLFNQTLGKDPKFMEMFKVKSYVDRKDWVNSKLQTGEYSNESEANLNYLNAINNRTIGILNKQAYDLGTDQIYLEQKLGSYKQRFAEQEFGEGSEEYQEMVRLEQLKSNTDNALNVVSQLKAISQSGNKAAINVMVDSFDNQNAYNYFNSEIENAVNVLIAKDYERTVEVDPYSMEQYKFDNTVKLKQIEYNNEVALENRKQSNRLALERVKAEINPNDGSGGEADKMNKLDQAIQAVNLFNVKDKEAIAKSFRQKFPNASDIEVEDFFNGSSTNSAHSKYAKELELIRRYEKASLKQKANYAADKANQPIVYPESLMKNEITSLDDADYENSIDETVKYLNLPLNISQEDLYLTVSEKYIDPKYSKKLLSEIVYDVLKNK